MRAVVNLTDSETTMGNADLISFANDDALAQAAAKALLAEAKKLDDPEASYSVALSGGRIAVKFYSEIAANARSAVQ